TARARIPTVRSPGPPRFVLFVTILISLVLLLILCSVSCNLERVVHTEYPGPIYSHNASQGSQSSAPISSHPRAPLPPTSCSTSPPRLEHDKTPGLLEGLTKRDVLTCIQTLGKSARRIVSLPSAKKKTAPCPADETGRDNGEEQQDPSPEW